jgi:hypothetical protein
MLYAKFPHAATASENAPHDHLLFLANDLLQDGCRRAPKNTTLWLELRPPGTTATVQLRGTLVWVATPGACSRATPPGFGLQIDANASPVRDLKPYRDAYSTLAQIRNQIALCWRP